MKTYRINKYAERFAREVAVTPELVYSISLVQFQAKNCRCIAAWTPGMTRPRYAYKVHTPEEYDKAMERIRQEVERFRRHDEAQEKASAPFRESLRRHPLLVVGLGADQYRLLSGHGDSGLHGATAAARPANYRRRLYVRNDHSAVRCFQGQDPYAPSDEKLYPHRLLPHCMEMGRAALAVQLVRITLH